MKTLTSETVGEYTEKKSVFTANLAPVSTEEAALVFVEKIKRENKRARHHCFAYIVRHEVRGSEAARYSDDGEPKGTAGLPMLTVLQKSGLMNVVCVVSRHFGGIKLGASGLCRAYTKAVANAVKLGEFCDL
ncbi:hypothetical protein FACS1894120_1680 [Clostridia bacterium]|nr:hypothetical protein FACS1894120_1680 [Clostridia bacterium]